MQTVAEYNCLETTVNKSGKLPENQVKEVGTPDCSSRKMWASKTTQAMITLNEEKLGTASAQPIFSKTDNIGTPSS